MTLQQFRNRLDLVFWCGFWAHALMNSLVQDWMGLERYIEMCRQHWLNIPWWVWPPLILLVFLVQNEAHRIKPVYFTWQKEPPKQFELGGTIYEGHSREKS